MYSVFGKSGFLWCDRAVAWSYACKTKAIELLSFYIGPNTTLQSWFYKDELGPI